MIQGNFMDGPKSEDEPEFFEVSGPDSCADAIKQMDALFVCADKVKATNINRCELRGCDRCT